MMGGEGKTMERTECKEIQSKFCLSGFLYFRVCMHVCVRKGEGERSDGRKGDFCLSDRKWISYNSILTSPFSNLENCLDPYSRYHMHTHAYTRTHTHTLHADTSQRCKKRYSCRVGDRTAD